MRIICYNIEYITKSLDNKEPIIHYLYSHKCVVYRVDNKDDGGLGEMIDRSGAIGLTKKDFEDCCKLFIKEE